MAKKPEIVGQATAAELLGTGSPPIDVQSDVDTGSDTIDKDKIDAILQSTDVQVGGKIRIERRGPTDQLFQYVCRIPVEDFDIERLKLTYGGGDYKCQTFRGNGQMYKPFNFSIDYRFKGSLDDQQIKLLSGEDGKANADRDRQNVLLQQLAVQRTNGSNEMMMQMFQMSSERSDRMFQLMMQQNAESQKATATIMAAVLSNRGNGIDPMVMELIKAQLANKPVVPSTDPLAQMATLKELLGLARELTGPPKEEKEVSMVEKIFTAAAPLLERWASPGRDVAPRLPQPTRVVAQPARPEPSADHVPDATLFKAMINTYLTQIIRAAERNSDPQLYADIIIENLPDDKLRDVVEILTTENWREILFNNDARVAQHPEWFEELRQLILSHGGSSGPDGNPEPSGSDSATGSANGSGANLEVAGKAPAEVSG